MKTKRCSKCKLKKLLSEFYIQHTRGDRPFSECKVCTGKHQREYHREHPEVSRRSSYKYWKKNRERLNRELRERYREKKAV